MKFMKLDIQLFSRSDGKIVIDTEINTKDFEKGLNQMKNSSKNAGGTIKNIVAGLGITKLITTAMNQITASIDGAIARYDTLNQFPRVMKTLGIASEDSEKAISMLSEGLSGLPTTLDQGALAVQRFTAKNGDVKKSADMFLAVNDAILAGGAPVVNQSAALEQLTQAYSRGKFDMQEWKSLQQAMPAQLKKVSDAMGYVSESDLYEAIQKGKVSMDDFIDTIITLDKEGGEGFASFKEQAKSGTSGIATSITVAKTQVVKGITDMIGKIEEGLKNANLPSISEMIKKVGDISKKVLDKIADKIPDLISALAPVISSLLKNLPKIMETLKKLEPVLIPIVSAIAAFMAVGKLISIIKGVAGAISVLSGVLIANPIGLVVGAIVGLVAAFVILWKKSDAFREFWINLWNGIKETFGPVIDSMIEMFKSAWDLIKVVWDKVKPYFEQLVSFLKFEFELFKKVATYVFKSAWEVIKGVWSLVVPYFQTFFNVISGIFKAIKNVLTGNFKGAWENIKGVFSNVGSFFSTVKRTIFNAFSNIASNFFSIGKDILRGIWDGMSDTSWLKNKIREWVGNIKDFLKKMFKIGSPSKLMRDEIGIYLAQGVGVGFTDELSSVYANMQKAINFENAKLQSNVEMGKVFNTAYESTPITVNLDASVEMDNQKVGRLVAPSVMQTVKTKGGY